MKSRLFFCLAYCWWLLANVAPAADALDFPPAAKNPVIESWFGLDLLDHYHWLEDATNPAVPAYAEAQNARTRKYLDALPEASFVPDAAAPFETTRLEVKTAHRTIYLAIRQPPGFQPDGKAPAILELVPSNDPWQRSWLQRGSIFITPEAATPPLSANELALCLQTLFAKNIAHPARLAYFGQFSDGTFGGHLLTDHPSLFRAVVLLCPIFDQLHARQNAAGTWEKLPFGSLPDRVTFNAALADSPYYRVADGTKYPAVLLLAEMARDGAGPFQQACKMTARLQEATASAHPVLLRASEDFSRTEEDIEAFLLHELGVATPSPGK